MGELGGGEIEDAEGVDGVVFREWCEGGKGGVDGKAGVDDFFLRDAPLVHGLAGELVGDEPVVGGGAEPGGVDFDGIGDDGEDGEFGAVFLFDAFDEVGVDGEGGDDGGGLVGFDEVLEVCLGFAHEGEALFFEVAFVGAAVDFFPDFREVGGDDAVGPLEGFGGLGGSEQAGVGDVGFDAEVVKGERKVAGGAVVALAEGGGEDEDTVFGGHLGVCLGRA